MRARPALLVALMLLVAGCMAPVTAPTNTTDSGVTTDGQTPPTTASDANPNGSTSNTSTTDTSTSNTSTTDTSSDVGSSSETDAPADPQALAATYDIDVDDADRMPESPALVYARMAVLTNETAALPPERVQVFPDGRMQLGSGTVPRFQRLLGITFPEQKGLAAAGYVDGRDRIVLNEGILGNNSTTESVLAHESVHILQFEKRAFSRTSSKVDVGDLRATTDAELAYRSTIEGTAVYAANEYHRSYMDTGTPPREEMAVRYAAADGGTRLALGPYHYGAEHVADRVNDSTELDDIYEQPPRTTSEVIHGVDPDRDPVASLSIETMDGETWTERSQHRDRLGELYFRVALATELADERAAAAGTGWRADKRLAFTDGNQTSYVWVLRFSDAANATEAETGLSDYLEARAKPVRVETPNGTVQVWTDEQPHATFRLVRVDDETIALVVGEKSFAAETDVEPATDTGNGTNASEESDDGVVVRPP